MSALFPEMPGQSTFVMNKILFMTAEARLQQQYLIERLFMEDRFQRVTDKLRKDHVDSYKKAQTR